MDATHPIRVVLFWNLEHDRDAFGPCFIGAAKKTWTFTQMVTHDQLVRKIFNHRGVDQNQWNVRMTMRVPDISKEDIHILVEFEPIQSQAFSDVQHTHISTHEDHSNVRQHITAITQMVFDKSLMLYPGIEKDDEDDDDLMQIIMYCVSNDENGNNDEEDDISTLLNPLSSTAVNQ
ncbi:hypothetical protein M9H77_25882 [Catharanthus roseus]|uniref:Uncharacterized protein n=1 Tax=Catharanthus roseus TaxID=4058 RepID=A0ACC0AA75_CATRO|nr:hypothetical protein M9H77_25882 [Catharanthus roseus]